MTVDRQFRAWTRTKLDEPNPDFVTAADPLGADAVTRHIPVMNSAGDLKALIDGLRKLVHPAPDLTPYSLHERLACMRDLGIFVGSIKRHGTEPAEVIPEIVPLLLELGRTTDMVPRDTVLHYTIWNPADKRRRTYVGDHREHTLQDAVREVIPRLGEALKLCDSLTDTDPNDPAFSAKTRDLAERLSVLGEVMIRVNEKVDPVFFARILRPFYEDITVAGERLLGPAAAQVPLWLADLVAWASDRSAPGYNDFLSDSVKYCMPRWRKYYTSWAPKSSLVTRLSSAVDDDKPTGRNIHALHASAKALLELMRVITVFRGRHIRMARQAYKVDLRLYPTGSAGGSVDLLEQILRLTRDATRSVQESMNAIELHPT
jgi:monodechloroaminopyrrolnitrin synthase